MIHERTVEREVIIVDDEKEEEEEVVSVFDSLRKEMHFRCVEKAPPSEGRVSRDEQERLRLAMWERLKPGARTEDAGCKEVYNEVKREEVYSEVKREEVKREEVHPALLSAFLRSPHPLISEANLCRRILTKMRILSCGFSDAPQPLSVSSRVVSVVRFDSQGGLFAVGGSAGRIRVYDFDEFSRAAVGGVVRPACEVSFNVGPRQVKCIEWLGEATLCVTFAFSCEVCVYSLLDEMDGGMGQLSPKHVLRSGVNKRVGNSALMVAMLGRIDAEIVVGSTSGRLSMWRYIGPRRSKPKAASSVLWEVEQGEAEVMGVFNLKSTDLLPSIVVSILKNGSVCHWDPNNLSCASFQRVSSPKCVQRTNLFTKCVMGVKGVPGSVCECVITFSDGIYIYNYGQSSTLHTLSSKGSPEYMSNRQFAGNVDDSNVRESVNTTPAVVLNCALHKQGTLLMSASSNRCCVESQHFINICHVGNMSFTGRGENNHHVVCDSRKEFGFTLPGHILSAKRCSNEITVSSDLFEYVCGRAECSNKMNKLLLDWGVRDPLSLDPVAPCNSTSTTCAFVESYVQLTRTLILNSYTGPNVTNGCPRVYLRGSMVTKSYHRELHHRHALTMICENSVTALEAHPRLPFVIAGFENDCVRVVGPNCE